METNRIGLLLASTLCLAAILGCSRFQELANQAGKQEANQPTAEGAKGFTLAGKEWKQLELDKTDVSAEFPGTPVDKTPPLPPNVRQVFSAIRIHAYDEKDFQSSVSQLTPTGSRKLTVKELADTSMAAVKKQIPTLTYTLDLVSDTKARYNGAFTRNGKTYDVRGCCIYKKGTDSRVWAVITLFPNDNADARTASERIISSAVFKGSTDECE